LFCTILFCRLFGLFLCDKQANGLFDKLTGNSGGFVGAAGVEFVLYGTHKKWKYVSISLIKQAGKNQQNQKQVNKKE